MSRDFLKQTAHRGLFWASFVMAGCVTLQVNPAPEGEGGGWGVGGMGGTGGAGGVGGSEAVLPYCTGGEPIVFATRWMFFGDTDLSGTPNTSTGWKDYGLNLDGLVSTKESTDLCKPTAGGSVTAVYPDGNNGIDNAWGKNILPIMLGLSSDFSKQTNQQIAEGKFTLLLKIENFTPGQNCRTVAKLYVGSALAQAPTWDGSDVWPLDPVFLATALNVYPEAELTGMKLRSVTGASFDLNTVSISGFLAPLPLEHAQVEVDIDFDAQGATMMLGARMQTSRLVANIATMAGAFDSSFCDPTSPTLLSILKQVEQASDMTLSGKYDPAQECEAISIGLAFKMQRANLGQVAPPAPMPPDPCAPCVQSCAEAASSPTYDPSPAFCATPEGTTAQSLYNAVTNCMCMGNCKMACGSNWCSGAAISGMCQNCVFANEPAGCGMAFVACSNN